jgi:MYXO-CTERM domain-containing protein
MDLDSITAGDIIVCAGVAWLLGLLALGAFALVREKVKRR